MFTLIWSKICDVIDGLAPGLGEPRFNDKLIDVPLHSIPPAWLTAPLNAEFNDAVLELIAFWFEAYGEPVGL